SALPGALASRTGVAVVCAAGHCSHRARGHDLVAPGPVERPDGRTATGASVTDPAIGPPERPAVLLGIDSGGSHTAVVVGDRQGRVLARAEGPGSAMRPGGAEQSAAVILDVVRRAAIQAKVSLPANIALVGAAGAGRAPEQEALAAAITAAGVAERVDVRRSEERRVGKEVRSRWGTCA